MKTYKILKIDNKIQDNVKLLFDIGSVECLNTDIFKDKKWKTLCMQSRPFIDEDSYKYFRKLFSVLSEKDICFISFPFDIGEDYLLYNELPNFEMFDEAMEEHNLRYTGGVAYGRSMQWAIHSDPDNHLLFLGYNYSLNSKVLKFFSDSEYLCTLEDVRAIYNE